MKFGKFSLAGTGLPLLLLAACGGDNGNTDQAAAAPPQLLASGIGIGIGTAARMTPAAAARFLGQASFGPTSAAIADVGARGADAWLSSEFAKPQTSHRAAYNTTLAKIAPGSKSGQDLFLETFWQQAAQGDDQLRQRVKFALSEIFVISLIDAGVGNMPRGVAGYYDMLGKHAFGNFRDLLQDVALHPMMGRYLSHLGNQRESGERLPDENFAREIMQLMSIGLYQLNQDGSPRTQNGTPIETYNHDDVAGLAKVFTGWSWAGPDASNNRFYGGAPDPERDWKPMQLYPRFHSTSEKHFLGVSVNGSGEAELKLALDTLFNHPNVGPFFGRQLIQRLVSSNPSPGYINRVAAAFANNGKGVRGDMKAVLRAVLLDPEARQNFALRAGKLREPVLRLANWMRAFEAHSASGRYQIPQQDDPLSGLGQTAMRSPSVFNFFRPSYTPPNTSIAAAGLVAPEMQITAEPSVTGYLNLMQDVVPNGVGYGRDVQAGYAAELKLAANPAALVDRVNLLLMNGAMTSALRGQILSAINSVPLPAATAGNAAAAAAAVARAQRNRVYLAVYLSMASPEYLVQK
ncbi:DUF1800 domain-containing protein [Rugamonas rubra]|uniref:Uncharacterized conserved protein, DUF1800 family n=1 Tax=Rugamonas rubra TaxID=758825 RepID=A0A1I4S8C1_9BURK|nr:DUF1800 domain-containing protein [Rugamonas rubra]SFM60719.1 Uncharacterized conserved protein, DUF1800 family [Rugamonas rubra]